MGRGCLAVASSTRDRKMPPSGEFLRGRVGFFGPAGDLQGAGRPTWQGGSVAPTNWPAGDGTGQREETEGSK
jgi:hypothetical protein